MARRRLPIVAGRREELIADGEHLLGYMSRVGADRAAQRQMRRLEALRDRLPVVVQHGWQIGLHHEAGPFVLEPDDSVTPVQPVHHRRDRTRVVDYKRPDGSLVLKGVSR